MEHRLRHTVAVGAVTTLVGFTSSFAVVLAGLRAAGADDAQAASGLIVLCAAIGLGTLWLSVTRRAPIVLAWSTPGAALLAAQAGHGWPEAVGAFMVTGGLIIVSGLWPWLGRALAAIPPVIANAMLAGVLLPLCLRPFVELAAAPALVAPVLLTWLVLQRLAPRWATPAAFAVALGLVVVSVAVSGGLGVLGAGVSGADLAPRLVLTAPAFDLGAIVSIAIPLWIVTMASQNIPGMAITGAAGFRVPWRASMVLTGAATAAGAAAGGHAVNLAAITAALPASPEAHPDPSRRWVAAAASGGFYVALAAGAGALVALLAAGPSGLLAAVAGLALLGTLASSLAEATRETAARVPAVATVVLAASGVTLLGIGSAFWALALGLVLRRALAPRETRAASRPEATARPARADPPSKD